MKESQLIQNPLMPRHSYNGPANKPAVSTRARNDSWPPRGQYPIECATILRDWPSRPMSMAAVAHTHTAVEKDEDATLARITLGSFLDSVVDGLVADDA